MGVPIIFLAIAPLAGILALQLTPPFSSAAIVLSLVFSACGLVLLYKHLLLPLRTLTAAISQPCSREIPAIGQACDLVRALEDSLRAQQAAHTHAASEARAAHEELLHELQELRENRAATFLFLMSDFSSNKGHFGENFAKISYIDGNSADRVLYRKLGIY